jgi:hypothetical protein
LENFSAFIALEFGHALLKHVEINVDAKLHIAEDIQNSEEGLVDFRFSICAS